MKTTIDTHAALAETARALRARRKRAEDENLARSQIRAHVHRRRQARAAVSHGVTKARETWIGTRWYAQSHPRLRHAAIAAAVVTLAAVSLAVTRKD